MIKFRPHHTPGRAPAARPQDHPLGRGRVRGRPERRRQALERRAEAKRQRRVPRSEDDPHAERSDRYDTEYRHAEVLVIGAGSIGLLNVAALKALAPSCRVTVLARHSFQAEHAKRLGAERIQLPVDALRISNGDGLLVRQPHQVLDARQLVARTP